MSTISESQNKAILFAAIRRSYNLLFKKRSEKIELKYTKTSK